MLDVLLCCALLVGQQPTPPDTLFVRVGPLPLRATRTPGQNRAVLLLPGLNLAPLHPERAMRAGLRAWQLPESDLVRRLSSEADVYAYAYAQTLALERLVEAGRLPRCVQALRAAGYREIILVGHSAGGLLARHLVEDHPNLGVTKVIQVCAPNSGSPLAGMRATCSVQMDFLTSLSVKGRTRVLEERRNVQIPSHVEFACIVGRCLPGCDGAVGCGSQWSADLQEQGVPAFRVRTLHGGAMNSERVMERIVDLVSHPVPRWGRWQTESARRQIFFP